MWKVRVMLAVLCERVSMVDRDIVVVGLKVCGDDA